MTPEETAQQLELAAQILRTGHPWEYEHRKGLWQCAISTSLKAALCEGWQIRPILATPPDNRPLHNPDNLTAEQVGGGYRLALKGEALEDGGEMWTGTAWLKDHGCKYVKEATFRLPLSVPWPEPTDPYAELKAARKQGKSIQCKLRMGCGWTDYTGDFSNADSRHEFRVVDAEPAFQLPPCAPGMRWHGKAWVEGDLPSGYRPLVMGEELQPGDEGNYGDDFFVQFTGGNTNLFPQYHYRTTRPLTFQHEGKTWTWHKPGDPMPCDGEARIEIVCLYSSKPEPVIELHVAANCYWLGGTAIVGWRCTEPQTKTVPLGPEDVKPFTVIRRKGEAQAWHWRTVSYVDGVKVTCGNRGYGWVELASDYERNESLPLTGKWNPDAWEPCSKTVPV